MRWLVLKEHTVIVELRHAHRVLQDMLVLALHRMRLVHVVLVLLVQEVNPVVLLVQQVTPVVVLLAH